MLRQLKQGKAHGVIIHKIDRSARNLKDWADLGELIDAGVEVQFANESLDLNTRGGRLSADIQAVVASDYIRNLREETKKGFYGRLKQGLYPLPAPVGYLNTGKGKVKEIDPATAPLVAKAFELYSTAQYPLHRLLEELHGMGLRNRRGGGLSLNGLSTILNNPFYMGLVRIGRTGELFPGGQQPLVSKSRFERVQMILRGKTVNRIVQHNFTFRRLIRCGDCGRTLIGELQKGHVYYRCQTRSCPTKTKRQESIEAVVHSRLFQTLQFDQEELDYIEGWMARAHLQEDSLREQELQSCRLALEAIRGRLNRVTDAFIDGAIDKHLFEERKNALLVEEKDLQGKIRDLEAGGAGGLKRLEGFLELIKHAVIAYENANPDEKRNLLKILTSNLTADAKNVDLKPNPSVEIIVKRPKVTYSSPYRGTPRTWDRILEQLLKHFTEDATSVN